MRASKAIILKSSLAYLTQLGLFSLGFVLAAQLRLNLRWGNPLGADYEPYPPMVWGIMGVISLLGWGIYPHHALRRTLLSVGLSGVSWLVLLPALSGWQVVYFGGGMSLWLVLLIGLPRRWRAQNGVESDLWQELGRLWQRRYLIRLWLNYRIESRYTQTLLGILWIGLLPLCSVGVMAFALTEVLGIQTATGVPYVAFLLSAQVLYNFFSNTVLQSKNALLGMVGIANQIYFPREIIIVLLVGEALTDFAFSLVTVILILVVAGVYPSATYVWLLIPFLIMLSLTTGFSFIFSWWSVLIRDFQQLLTVILQFLFFLVPILYALEQVPNLYRPWVMANPLAVLIDSWRNILLYREPPVLSTLAYPAAMGVTVLYLGYTYFKVNEDRLGDFA